MSSKVASSGGSLLLTLVTVLFVGLKLAEIGAVANWSWWWVLSPLWVPIGFGLSLFAVGGLLYLIDYMLDKK